MTPLDGNQTTECRRATSKADTAASTCHQHQHTDMTGRSSCHHHHHHQPSAPRGHRTATQQQHQPSTQAVSPPHRGHHPHHHSPSTPPPPPAYRRHNLSARLAAVALAVALLGLLPPTTLVSAARQRHQHQHQPQQADGGRKATVQGPQCSYTLVVQEVDSAKCPYMQADQRAPPRWPQALEARDSGQPGRHPSHEADAGAGSGGRGGGGGGGGGEGGQEVDVLKSQVKDMEGRLLEEMVRSRELNSTLARHSTALKSAEQQMASYTSNFTAIYRALVFVQRQLAKQRKINRSLNKKVSNVLLDVVEVNNVLTRGPSRDVVGGADLLTGHAVKKFDVQSVAKVRTCPGVTDKSTTYKDCAAVFEGGHKQSGVYYVKPTAAACPVPVWCDMDTPPGGWLVFQRRQDGSVSFKRDWNPYRDGFGNVAGEYWLGNDNIFLLTNQDHYQMRVDLWDFSGNRVYAVYSKFVVGGERDKYRLTATGYSGSASDSLYRHNAMAFSTPDRDNDGRKEAHCASEWEAGWWFNNCWFAMLNGAYYNRSDVAYRGIAWNHWKREQLRKTEMKIRPIN